jgi:hypothetical protein
MFLAVMIWPSALFPLVWISLFLAMDPLACLIGGRSITAQVREGHWDTVLVLFASTLICGLFWELWNWRSMPKWEYAIPYADWLHIFEMPMLGYGGYLPFGLELFAFVNLVDRLLSLNIGRDFRFDQAVRDS